MKAINAIIDSAEVKLVYDDRFLDFPIGLKLAGGSWIRFGGRMLCHAHDDQGDTNYAGQYICKVFDVVGANSVSSLVGKPVRAIFEKDGRCGDKIIGIQNFIDYKKYFVPGIGKDVTLSEEDMKQLTEYV